LTRSAESADAADKVASVAAMTRVDVFIEPTSSA
jgi:hypothetical protein